MISAPVRLTEREASRHFRVGRNRLRVARLRRELPFHHQGHWVFYWAADIVRWLEGDHIADRVRAATKPTSRRVVPLGTKGRRR